MSVVFDPFTPAPADVRCLHEEYQDNNAPNPALKLFYKVKPAIPWSVQMSLRRGLAKRQAQREFPAWPIEPALLRSRASALQSELSTIGHDELQVLEPWPEGKRFAISITHDVEGPRGIERIPRLLELERRYGFVSSWNFVAEWYPLSDEVRQSVRDAGCEVGLHGITHDGALFRDRQSFEASLPKIRHYLDAWDAVGFRSPSTLRNAAWMHELPVSYDSSYPDTDPFQPQSGGCCWIFPFFFGEVVELPMTLDQDHTLFVLFKERTIRRWVQKSEWIIANRGLINVNVHPDYMDGEHIHRYEELLQFLSQQPDGWHALPRDVAAWWRERARISSALNHSSTMSEGGLNGRARLAWARLQGEQIVYRS
jgi:peptidoglycan/xylan/chitin deacetylase (PgdA/CDA1 family)